MGSKEIARRVGILDQNATTPRRYYDSGTIAHGHYPHQPLFSRWRQQDEEAVQQAM